MMRASDETAKEIVAGTDVGWAARPAPRTLRELLLHPELLEPPPAIVPNVAYSGRVTLLSSREKVGKSTLLGQACAACSHGEEFLGAPTKASTVLWYAIDEPLGDAARRFHLYGADPERVFIQDARPTAEELRREIETTGANLVVIDVLSTLWLDLIVSDGDAQDVGSFIRPMVQVIRQTDAALVLLSHSRKDASEYRGSVELGAAVDLVLTFRSTRQRSEPAAGQAAEDDGSDDGTRTLRGTGRGVKVDLRLFFDGTRYSANDEPLELSLRILHALWHGDASGNALAKQLHARKDGVLAELRKLEDDRFVERVAGSCRITELGRRRLSGASESVPDSSSCQAPGLHSGTHPGTHDDTPLEGASRTSFVSEPRWNRQEPHAGTDRVALVPNRASPAYEPGTDADD